LIQGAAKIINMTVWETTRLPKHWITKTIESGIDAFIVPCRWNEKVFHADTGVKTYLLPHVIDTLKEPRKDAKKIIPDVFNILTVSQWIYRKGFDALIKAYLMEFCHDEPVTLIVKSYRSDTTKPEQDIIRQEIQALRGEVFVDVNTESRAKIFFIGGLLSREEMDALYSGCDLFALTSRGEGFGLPYTEAITHGKPVLCPDAGGHVDFIDSNAAYRVAGSFEPCHSQGMFYTSEMDWFEPSVRSIRKHLRQAFVDWQEGRIHGRGERCLAYVKRGGYDYATIGNGFYDILQEVCGCASK